MRKVLVLGAGKSATILIKTLLEDAREQDWFVHVADADINAAERKIQGNERARAHYINPQDRDQLTQLVGSADAVISMLPPPFHAGIARACLHLKKHFLNASYLTPELQEMDKEVSSAGLSFLVEMGLDPGIDHMSAMEMINSIREKGASIKVFRSHCGGLISPESDNNPWHYKISWNPRNIVLAGKDGATYLANGMHCSVSYSELFDPERTVNVPGMGNWAWYPNRDSIAYIEKYGLQGVHEFVRTTLRHPDFAHGWKKIVDLGLTNETKKEDTSGLSVSDFFSPYLQGWENWDPLLKNQFKYLDLENPRLLDRAQAAPADILQTVLEEKLGLQPADRDMIIMLHEVGYTEPGDNKLKYRKASLVVKGEDQQYTAMAKTVGLPLAIAVRKILNGDISRKGVYIPIYPDVYTSVLKDLESAGIQFTMSE